MLDINKLKQEVCCAVQKTALACDDVTKAMCLPGSGGCMFCETIARQIAINEPYIQKEV